MTTEVTMTQPTVTPDYLPPPDPKAVEQAMLIGDISQMTDEQRIAYYVAVCRSVQLNPLTKPFQALKGDDGKMTLYPDKGCAEQLRKLHRVSVKVIGREMLDDLYIVTVQARTPDGREEESQGVVPLAKAKGTWEQTKEGRRYFKTAVDAEGREITLPLSGTERASAMMRAETKAKRRVTLAICGLGMPDWEAEPASTAHPMPLKLQQSPPTAAGQPLAATIAEVYDVGPDHDLLIRRIDDLLEAQGLTQDERSAWWARMDQKYAGRTSLTLNLLYENLQAAAEKKQAEPPPIAETGTNGPWRDNVAALASALLDGLSDQHPRALRTRVEGTCQQAFALVEDTQASQSAGEAMLEQLRTLRDEVSGQLRLGE